MALFRRNRPEIDYDELAKALSPAIAMAGVNGTATVSPVPMTSNPYAQAGIQGFAPLPRSTDFAAGFGPGYPLLPEPIDVPGPNGRTLPRRSQYLVAWNLQLLDQHVPWTMLRWTAEDCDIVNRCIQIKQDEIIGYKWGWGFSDQIVQQIMTETGETNSARATQIAREKYGDELTRIQQFFETPDRDMGQTFSDWLQALLWDHLVYDGVAVYPSRNLDGSVRNLELIDAATIKVYRDNRGRVPQPPNPAFGQVLYGFPRGEFMQNPDEADDEFELDQLAYYIRRPRNTSVYGLSQVELAIPMATTYLARQQWMRAEYTTGTMPKMMMKVSGADTWTPEQMSEYERIFNDRLSGQIERRQQAFMLKEGFDPIFAPQIEDTYKSVYDDWLIMQIAARFGVAPTQLGVQAKAGLSGGKQMEGELDQITAYSTLALNNWIVDLLNDLARRFLGVGPEITATYNTGEGGGESALQEAQADVAYVAAGIVKRNEVRAKRGMPLADEPEADQLGITTGAGVQFLAGQLAQQEAALTTAQATAQTATQPEPTEPEVTDVNVGSDSTGSGAALSRAASTEKAIELKQFGKFIAKGKDPGTFKWHHHDAYEVAVMLGKAEARPSRWANHPIHAVHDQITTNFAPRVAKAFGQAVTGITRAVVAADVSLSKAAAPPPNDAQAQAARYLAAKKAISEAIHIDPAPITQTLRQMWATAAAAGSQVTAEQVGGNVIPNLAVGTVNWDSWVPGDQLAADMLADSGLDTLLDAQDATIEGISDSMLQRITDSIIDGIAQGTSVQQVGNDLGDVITDPFRAFTIANTETARAVSAATMAQFTQDDIGFFEWDAEPDACPICADYAERSAETPFVVGADDNPTQPAHPNCRCVYVASEGQTASETDSGDEGDAETDDAEGSDDEAEKALHGIVKADSFTPPKGVQAAAQRAVGWIEDGKAGDGFTATGSGRAHDLAAGRSVSLDVVTRMKAYFDRHQPDQHAEGFDAGEDGYPSPGRVAWDAWGGDAGYAWAQRIVAANAED